MEVEIVFVPSEQGWQIWFCREEMRRKWIFFGRKEPVRVWRNFCQSPPFTFKTKEEARAYAKYLGIIRE